MSQTKEDDKNVLVDNNEDKDEKSTGSKDSEIPDFFYWNAKQSKVKLITLRVVNFIRSLGFYRIDIADEYNFIRVVDSIAEQCSITKIQDVFFDKIKELPKSMKVGEDNITKVKLMEALYDNLSNCFNKGLLSRLGTYPNIEFLKADKNSTYFFFKNNAIKVSEEAVENIEYSKLKGQIIWKDSILDKDFDLLSFNDFNGCVFARFIRNLSKSKDKEGNNIFDSEREKALKTIIGYNLHPFFETKLKATIFTDTGVSNDAEGRTGKTLITRAKGKMLNTRKESKTYVELSGKNFDFSKPFRYDLCKLGTKLIHINDAKDKFQFELLYNDITEGVTVEAKGKSSFIISSKIIISSNKTIKLNGGSDKDRAIEFQVSDHYSINHSPEDDFGHWFFRDWDNAEWNKFFNYMVNCVQEYFINGLVQPENIDLETRKLIEETCPEFIDFMDDFFLKIENGKHYDKKGFIFRLFKEAHPSFEKMQARSFTRWLNKWAKSYSLIESYEDYKSNNLYEISFIKNSAKSINDIEKRDYLKGQEHLLK